MSTSSGFVPKHKKANEVSNDGVYQNTLMIHDSLSPLQALLALMEKFCSERFSKRLHREDKS